MELMDEDSATLSTLRMAVAGPHDLEPPQMPDIRALVQRAAGWVIDTCSAARVELVTAMADSADPMVATVARELGCLVHIALPKPLDEYGCG